MFDKKSPWAVVTQNNKLFNSSSFCATNANSLAHLSEDSRNYHVLRALGEIHIWRPRKWPNFQDHPPPLSSCVKNSSTPLTFDVQFQTSPSLQMITNQYKENVTQVMLSGLSFRSAFVFRRNWLTLPPIGFFPLSWNQTHIQNISKKLKTSFSSSSYSEKMCWGQCWAKFLLSAFSWLYVSLCEVVQKYHKIFFIYNYSNFQYSVWNTPVLFAQLENANELWNNNRMVHVNEWNQNKNKIMSHSKWALVHWPQTVQWYH